MCFVSRNTGCTYINPAPSPPLPVFSRGAPARAPLPSFMFATTDTDVLVTRAYIRGYVHTGTREFEILREIEMLVITWINDGWKVFLFFSPPFVSFPRKRNNAAVIEGISREERRFRAFVGISEKYTLSSFLFSFWRKIEDRLEIDWRTECARMRDSRLRACTRACAALRVIDVVRARYLRSMPVCTAKHTRCVSSRAAYTMQRARWLMTCKGTVQRETETHTREFTRGASLHNRVSPRKICLSPPLDYSFVVNI